MNHKHQRLLANLPLGAGARFSFPLATTTVSDLSLFQNCHHLRFFLFCGGNGGGGLIGIGARADTGRLQSKEVRLNNDPDRRSENITHSTFTTKFCLAKSFFTRSISIACLSCRLGGSGTRRRHIPSELPDFETRKTKTRAVVEGSLREQESDVVERGGVKISY